MLQRRLDHAVIVRGDRRGDTAVEKETREADEARVHFASLLERHRRWLLVGSLAQPYRRAQCHQLTDIPFAPLQIRLDDDPDVRMFGEDPAEDAKRSLGIG